ncbi:proline--tRNA ligase [Sporosarcina sp. NCCP-2716]|uniref:YbaK/EbsC family protein n=1 Tax=Sporosarcina sp. NCCP-2716 TaxID=2943679 RepID=UPI00204024C0|nr:YbaK/EbsC family protein [Sporosarcina sp. NCCP-2716]GKV67834.1 proline--tRNA ligase [Sporosarcina sp. NCCP-2716]
MKQSGVFIPAAESPNHCVADRILARAGYVQETSEGMYAYFPLAGKVLDNIKQIIRSDMEAAGVLEVDLPYEQFAHASGKSDEMIFLSFIEKEVISSEQLPISVFHIKQHVRSGERLAPENGLLSAKEFALMSGYSFHTDTAEAIDHSSLLHGVFSSIFSKIGVPFSVLQSEQEIGMKAYEFVAFPDCGDEWIARNESGTYVAKAELTEALREGHDAAVKQKPAEKAAGSGRTGDQLAEVLRIGADRVIHSYLYEIDGDPAVVLIRGDRKLNELKLQKACGAASLIKLPDANVKEVLGTEADTLGPVQLPFGFRVLADYSVETVVNGLCGANEADTFLLNVNPDRDFTADEYMDIRLVTEGEPSPDGNGTLAFSKGTVFARILDPKPVFSKIDIAGKGTLEISTGYSYMDLTRLFAVTAEYYSDGLGLKWPLRLAPYDVHLLIDDYEDDTQRQLAEELNSVMNGYRYRILYDERNVSLEEKKRTSDMLGIPVKITVASEAADGMIEVTYRSTGETHHWRKEEVTEKLQEFFRTE